MIEMASDRTWYSSDSNEVARPAASPAVVATRLPVSGRDTLLGEQLGQRDFIASSRAREARGQRLSSRIFFSQSRAKCGASKGD